jgi:hypothetical protein
VLRRSGIVVLRIGSLYNVCSEVSITQTGEASMTTADLTNQTMALPAAERAAIALKVWESIEDEHVAISPDSDAKAVEDALRRDHEMSHGEVPERSHEEVMKNARRLV